MSNLLKSRNIVCDNKDKKVIDYNELISEKILKIQEAIEKEHKEAKECEFVEGLDATSVEKLLTDNENQEETEEALKSKANDIIEMANEDAKAIIERAKSEADIIRIDSANVGKEEGYQQGKQQAQIEYEALKKSVEDERRQMQIEYDKKFDEMEPVLVETLLKVFSKVTHVLSDNNKELIIELVNDVLSKTEISKEFLIRVSGDDYQFILDNRDKINGVVSKKVQIEIVEDPTFKKGQCMIESDSGIYDCSLDVQMDNLINSIRAMSCMVED